MRRCIIFLLALGCRNTAGERSEGTEVGDCTDRADNDGDGLFDCDDDGCSGSPDCPPDAESESDPISEPTDENTDEDRNDHDLAPEIAVSPTAITFAEVDAAANLSETQSVRVENIGDGDLIISDVDVSNHTGPFRVEPFEELRLSPDSSTDVLITFAPDTAGDFQGEVMIESNDPREPYVFISLSGLGIAPVIDATPSTHDFGTVMVGCTQTEAFSIKNIGTANLLVSDFSFSTASTELAIDLLEDTNGPLPWSISPNASKSISLTYRPFDTVTDQAFLTISTNDPYTPDILVTQEGRGEFFGENEDIYTQEMGNTSFTLSQFPVPQTIEVAIDGVVTTVGWSYNSALNAVEWNSAPAVGSSISVQYAIVGECD